MLVLFDMNVLPAAPEKNAINSTAKKPPSEKRFQDFIQFPVCHEERIKRAALILLIRGSIFRGQ